MISTQLHIILVEVDRRLSRVDFGLLLCIYFSIGGLGAAMRCSPAHGKEPYSRLPAEMYTGIRRADVPWNAVSAGIQHGGHHDRRAVSGTGAVGRRGLDRLALLSGNRFVHGHMQRLCNTRGAVVRRTGRFVGSAVRHEQRMAVGGAICRADHADRMPVPQHAYADEHA